MIIFFVNCFFFTSVCGLNSEIFSLKEDPRGDPGENLKPSDNPNSSLKRLYCSACDPSVRPSFLSSFLPGQESHEMECVGCVDSRPVGRTWVCECSSMLQTRIFDGDERLMLRWPCTKCRRSILQYKPRRNSPEDFSVSMGVQMSLREKVQADALQSSSADKFEGEDDDEEEDEGEDEDEDEEASGKTKKKGIRSVVSPRAKAAVATAGLASAAIGLYLLGRWADRDPESQGHGKDPRGGTNQDRDPRGKTPAEDFPDLRGGPPRVTRAESQGRGGPPQTKTVTPAERTPRRRPIKRAPRTTKTRKRVLRPSK